MDLKRLMCPLLPLAVVAAISGCSSADDSGGEESNTSPAASEESSASPLEGVDEPVELELPALDGWEVVEGAEREFPVSEAVNTYALHLEGGADTAQLMVSTYVLDSAVDDTDYQAVVGLIREYDATFGHELTAENDRGTIASGRSGVGMLIGYDEGDTRIVQQNHYFFEASHAIQVTCQWTNPDFQGVYAGCQELLSAFPFPDGWDS